MAVKNRDERDLQIALIEWLCRVKPHLFNMTFSVPNEGARSWGAAKDLTRMGMRSGVPDVCIAYPKGTYHGLFLELKKSKKDSSDGRSGVLSETQKDWISKLNCAGYLALCAWGIDEAHEIINHYDSNGTNLVHIGGGKWQLIQHS